MRDEQFQRVYRSYWQMGAARLSDGFCNAYFGLPEELKAFDRTDVDSVAIRLFNIASSSKGERQLHFSFSTKIVYMMAGVVDANLTRKPDEAVAEIVNGGVLMGWLSVSRPPLQRLVAFPETRYRCCPRENARSRQRRPVMPPTRAHRRWCRVLRIQP